MLPFFTLNSMLLVFQGKDIGLSFIRGRVEQYRSNRGSMPWTISRVQTRADAAHATNATTQTTSTHTRPAKLPIAEYSGNDVK
jgi:hypothetical protein